MKLNPLVIIEKLINEHGSSTILKERLLLVKDELTKLQKEHSELIAHCPECKRPLWNDNPVVFPYECSTKGCGYMIMIHEPLDVIAEKLNNN